MLYIIILYPSGRNTTTRHVFVDFFKLRGSNVCSKHPQKYDHRYMRFQPFFKPNTLEVHFRLFGPVRDRCKKHFRPQKGRGLILGMIMPFRQLQMLLWCSNLLIHFISGRSIIVFYNPSTFITYKIKTHRDFHAGEISIYRVITIFVKKNITTRFGCYVLSMWSETHQPPKRIPYQIW